MAIFSKKQNTEIEETTAIADTPSQPIVFDTKASNALIVPRLSEKAGAANKLNKYIFTVTGKLNKVELRKAVERMYGVKIARVNMVVMKSKSRRFGRTIGKTASYKKAIITLTPESKKIDLVEPS